jgi:hypothetical protein
MALLGFTVYSLGIPVFFLCLLRASNKKKDATTPQLGLAFLKRGFKTEASWFELVEYSKKLLMTGLLMKAAQGSSSQICIGLVISLFYFALVVRWMPYQRHRTNLLRVVSELQLFLTMLCALMMRLDLHEEWITKDAIATALVGVNFVMTPAPFTYDVITKSVTLMSEIEEATRELRGSRNETTSREGTKQGLGTGLLEEESESDETDVSFCVSFKRVCCLCCTCVVSLVFICMLSGGGGGGGGGDDDDDGDGDGDGDDGSHDDAAGDATSQADDATAQDPPLGETMRNPASADVTSL